MNTDFTDFLFSYYGLINGSLSDVVNDFVSKEFTKRSKFHVFKETTDFQEAVKFFEKLTFPPTRHVLFQHTPDWVIMISNAKNGLNFEDYQYGISNVLKRKNIRVVDAGASHNYEARIFSMYDEDYNLVRSVICMDDGGKWFFDDSGKGFPEVRFANHKNIKTKDKFDSKDLSKLVMMATKYDSNLEATFESKFVLLTETYNNPDWQKRIEEKSSLFKGK